MENLKENQKQAKQQTDAKQPYEPPKAIFVPLKIEERLLACSKTPADAECQGPMLIS